MSYDAVGYLILSSLLLAAVAVPGLWPRWPLWLRVFWRVSAFVALTLAIQRLTGSPIRPRFDALQGDLRVWAQFVVAGWWVLAGRVAAGLARLLLALKRRPDEARIMSDLISGGLYVATGLAVVAVAFSVPVGGLLATSGVIAIVLGLALQSTLSDVFSGIAVGLEKPYQAGDLIWVEGGIEGRVVQINWRSTQIGTIQNNVAVVPNSIIAKSRLVNRSAPTLRRGDNIKLRLDARASPERCLRTLEAAVRACGLLLADPAPTVSCTGLHGDGVEYEVDFSVASTPLLQSARNELYVRIHRHLDHEGIALAVPGKRPSAASEPLTLRQVLSQSDLFGSIAPPQRDHLADHFTTVRLEVGDVLLHSGEVPTALYVIASGTAEISRDGTVFTRLSPGETLGATGLIHGDPIQATAVAATPMLAYRLDRDGIAAALATDPELSTGLESLVERGLAAMRRDVTASGDSQRAELGLFLTKLRSFLQLLAA